MAIILNEKKRFELFPAVVVKAAQESEIATGLPACITLAQWALESGFGKYSLGANNFFGLKAPKGTAHKTVNMRTTEFIEGKYVHVYATFLAFDSLLDCFSYHAELLLDSQGPYRHCLSCHAAWRTFISCMAPIYATDPQYAMKLNDLVVTWQLDEYNVHRSGA